MNCNVKYLLALISACFLFFVECSAETSFGPGEVAVSNETAKTTTIRLATFNIRSNYGSDTQDWKTRLVSIDSLLRTYNFDIIGSQEPYQRQINDLMKLHGDTYSYFVVNAKNSSEKASIHSNPIFYKKDRFSLLDSGVFWFSETPDVPGSVSWDASQARNCNWVKLFDKVNKTSFFVFNSHFDHESTLARNHSAKLLVEKVKSIAGDNLAFCTGDFNTSQVTNAFASLTKTGVLLDAHELAIKVVNDDYKTNHGYKVLPPADDMRRIDHILISRRSAPKKVTLWQCCVENFQGKWASDHYPVFIDFNL